MVRPRAKAQPVLCTRVHAEPPSCMTRWRRWRFVPWCLAAACVVGCGYRAGVHSKVLRGMRTVHVAPMSVDAREVGVQGLFTRALREELAARTGLRLASESGADVVLRGRLHAYERGGLAFPSYTQGSVVRLGEFRATAKASVILRRRSDGKTLLDSGELQLATEHLPGPDLMATEANRERAFRQLAADLARRVTELISDSF